MLYSGQYKDLLYSLTISKSVSKCYPDCYKQKSGTLSKYLANLQTRIDHMLGKQGQKLSIRALVKAVIRSEGF